MNTNDIPDELGPAIAERFNEIGLPKLAPEDEAPFARRFFKERDLLIVRHTEDEVDVTLVRNQ